MKKVMILVFIFSFPLFAQMDLDKTFSAINQCFPSETKAGVFLDAKKMSGKGKYTAACGSAGMTAIIVPLKNFGNLGPGFKQLKNNFKVTLMFIPNYRMSKSKKFRSYISKKCGMGKIALVVEDRDFVKTGALMCFEEQGGEIVAVINQKIATMIGFTPPDGMKVEMI